jgi:hypothetical protein
LSDMEDYIRATTFDGRQYFFRGEELSEMKAALRAGDAFYVGKDMDGEEIVLRLDRVLSLEHRTPEGLARLNARAKDAERQGISIVTPPGAMLH